MIYFYYISFVLFSLWIELSNNVHFIKDYCDWKMKDRTRDDGSRKEHIWPTLIARRTPVESSFIFDPASLAEFPATSGWLFYLDILILNYMYRLNMWENCVICFHLTMCCFFVNKMFILSIFIAVLDYISVV